MDLEQYPTLNQTDAHHKTSDRYTMIPTSRVLSVLADHGWQPARVHEASTRKKDNEGYQKHMVRLRQAGRTYSVGDEFAEIVLINSHMGSAAFRLMLGIFRLICGNGAVVGKGSVEDYSIRHVGYTDAAVEHAIRGIQLGASKVLPQIETWKSIELSQPEQIALASAAIEMRFDGEKFAVEPRHMLAPRRYDDKKNDLWTTFNRVQENVIRGGVRTFSTNGQRRRSRAVSSVDENIKLNRAL